jgi:hypothetical protein
MGLSVIEAESRVSGGEGDIVLEFDNEAGKNPYEELGSPEARNLAIKHATQLGLSSPGIGGIGEIFALDRAGKEIHGGSMDGATYRAVYPVRSNPV